MSENDMTRLWNSFKPPRPNGRAKRSERLDWINKNLRRQGHAVHTFRDVDEAIRQYNLVSGSALEQMEPKPGLSDFYLPSPEQRDREIAFVIMGLGATTFVAYTLTK